MIVFQAIFRQFPNITKEILYGKKPWQIWWIETNLPKFFDSYLDKTCGHVIWRICEVSKCLWSKVLAFEWWLLCDYKCSTGWLNSIEQSLNKPMKEEEALTHLRMALIVGCLLYWLNQFLCVRCTWNSCTSEFITQSLTFPLLHTD